MKRKIVVISIIIVILIIFTFWDIYIKSNYKKQKDGEKEYQKLSALIIEYTELSEVSGYDPPTYSVVGTNDGIIINRFERKRNYISTNTHRLARTLF